MIRILLASCLLFQALGAMGQTTDPRPSVSFGVDAPFRLDWEEAPRIHKLPDSLKRYSAAIVSDRRQNRYRQDGESFVLQRTVHRIVHIYDAKGVEGFNTLTLQVGEGNQMDRLKARTILPDGRVIKVDNNSIKTTKGENGARQYLVAFEGVEQGAEVEYLYSEKRDLSVFGTEQVQWTIPVQRAEISFVMPDQLKFAFRGYNGFPAPGTDTTISAQRVYRTAFGPIPPLNEEAYSRYGASLMRLDYKVEYITGKDDVRMFTWDDMARQLYEGFVLLSSKEERVAERFVQSLGLERSAPEAEKVARIEDALKGGIVINDALDEKVYGSFSTIVDKKLATQKSFTRFLAACLSAAGVKYQIGLTAAYADYSVDETFENWSLLDHYVFYLTGLKGFLDPISGETRYPFVPPAILYNKGIFCDVYSSGAKESARSRIRTITALPMESSGSNIDASISFRGEELTPEIQYKHFFLGYAALGLRDMFSAVSADKTAELAAGFVTAAEKKEDMESYSVGNRQMSALSSGKPLIVGAVVRAPHLMEKAGPKFLFKLGEIIGRQSEMYNQQTRKLPIQMEYPHTLTRQIHITIPEGYTLRNPEAVRFRATHQRDKASGGIGFISDYVMKGNVLDITVQEYYGEVAFPVADYEKFRQVINAAADFNKVVLVLEKKK